MKSCDDKKAIIKRTRAEIEASKGTRIWTDYVNALKLISQVVFTRSSGFVLELIQNAEDAGLGLDTTGEFQINLNERRVKIVHNGRPFTEEDVRSLCGIQSSKKPERGTLGYLGIGFKSVFKVTDCPEVYSGGFQFKFNRNHKEWGDPSSVPWHVLPIWLDEPSELIDSDKTYFIIPFREELYYQNLAKEIMNLNTELYLFLRWLKKIEMADEVSGQTSTLENVGEREDGVAILRRNGQQQRFKFFRGTCFVPDWVKQDRLTQEYRSNVTQREIAIAFALDHEGNLAPREARAMFGGVYSFLPLGEARSGAKFPIQADFLVQPGREAINYEAKWNHWLVEKVADLCKEAIDCFKNHPKWRNQFLPVFEFTKSKGLESYELLFGPKLIHPLEKLLKEDECVSTINGGWAKLSQVVRLDEDEKAIKDLVAMNLLGIEDVAPVMGGELELKLVDPLVKEPNSAPFKEVNRLGLMSNEAFLEEKREEPDAANWFRSLYLWLHRYPRWISPRKGPGHPEGYHYHKVVLTADGNLLEGGKVWLMDFELSDPILKELAEILKESRAILHPGIMAGAKSEEERKALRGFLTGRTGVQLLDSKTICKEAFLPKILITAPKPPPDVLLQYTIQCKEVLGSDIGTGVDLWVLTKQGEVRAAKEVIFPKEFNPERDWETHQRYVPGLNFASPRYLGDAIEPDDIRAWRQFLKVGGVKENPDNGVEEFAMNYAKERLNTACKSVMPVEKRNYGYDLEAETYTGEKMHIEVKGLTHDQDIELDRNETETADIYKDSFYLCVVCSIPGNPDIYRVRNPAMEGKKDKVRIPVDIWKVSRWLA